MVCAEHVGPAGFRRLVALKRPHADDPRAVERLLREARVGALLRHANVVATEDVGRDELGWFLVLEYVDGPTLWSVLTDHQERGRPVDAGAALELARQLCEGLAYAHALRDAGGRPLELVHGDLSPGNVLLSRRGEVKIADFGAARTALSPAEPATSRGTPGFAPPEAVAGRPLDARSDVFSVGAILRRLFALTELADLPALQRALDRATATDPEDRFRDAGALGAALEPLRTIRAPRGEGLATVAGAWTKALATLADETETASEPTVLPPRPYRGLEAFGPESAALFFGRQDDAHRLAQRVRQQPIVVLTGASGAGKSSLLAAGLPPRLPELAIHALRPGRDPVARLARATGLAREQLEAIAADARGDLPALAAPALLVVDQAEELLTLATPAAREAALAALARLAEAGGARVLLSVRADYLAALCDLEPLRGHASRGVELLALPGREQLRDALVRPLEPFGFRFETPDLVERIVGALVGQPGALALMQFCADRLWDARDVASGTLRAADYDAMGGVAGALTTYADRVLAELLPGEREIARRILVQCLRGGTRRPTLVQTLLSARWAEERGAHVLERLVSARLLSRRLDPENGPVVEPAHEALAAHWHALTRWVNQDAIARGLLDDLAHTATRWDKSGRGDDLLWRGDLLTEWRRYGAELGDDLGAVEQDFVHASVRHASRSRRRRIVTVSVAMAALLALGVVATVAWRGAESAEAEAQAARAHAEHVGKLDRAASHRVRGEVGRAVQLAREALRDAPGARDAVAELYAAVGGRSERAILTGHADTVRDGVFSPDGRYVLTGDMHGEVRLWGADGALVRAVQGDPGPIYYVRFEPSGDRFLTVGASGAVPIRRLDGALERTIAFGAHAMWASWDRTGARLLVCDRDLGIGLFDGAGERVGALAVGEVAAVIGAFSADGARAIVTGLGDDRTRIVSRDGALLATLPTGAEGMYAAFSDAGPTLVASWGGAVSVFDDDGALIGGVASRSRYPVARFRPGGDTFAAGSAEDADGIALFSSSGEPPRRLAAHRAPIVALAFSPAGDRLASASEDGEIRLHDPGDGREIAVLPGHTKRIWALAWSPDGAQLLSTSEDRTARLWDGRGRSAGRLAAGEAVELCPVDPGGERVVTLTAEGLASLYTLAGERLARWRAEGAELVAARWRPDGRGFALLRDDGGVELRDRDGLVWPAPASSAAVRGLAWSGDALVVGTDGAIGRLAEGARPLPVDLGAVTIVAPATADRGAASDRDRAVLYDLAARRVTPLPDAAAVAALCWSPDRARLVGVGRAGRGWLWGADGGLLATVVGHRERVVGCAWHPGGRRFATASWDGTARVWSRDGAPLEVIEGYGREVQEVSWSPDGERLLTEGWDGTATVRDERGILATFTGHGGEVIRADWARGGDLIVTCARGGEEVRVWPGSEGELKRWAASLVPESTSPR